VPIRTLDRSEIVHADPAGDDRAARALVTAAPPTPNGDLHVGHLAGPYLAADVHARFLRLQGVDATFALGSDDNSRWVVGMGESLGQGPDETARKFTDAILDTLERAGIDLAFFRPNESAHHRRLVQEVFRRLYDQGDLVEHEVPSAWCPSCDEMLFEYRVRGRCGHCGDEVAGHTCEACGWPNTGGDLADPVCTRCGSAAEVRHIPRLVFPVSRHTDRLREAYRHIEMPARLHAFCEEVLEAGALDFPVTQPGSWGIEVPVDGYRDQRINVWFEIGPRYLAYAEHLAEERGLAGTGAEGAGDGWRAYWTSPEAKVAQFFGVDNSFYYGLLVPALFMAFEPAVRLPVALVTNEFYRLDGKKFSTSRDHRIMGRALVAEAPRDAVRYFLARTSPEREETTFTREAFRATCRERLLDGWQTWLDELAVRAEEAAGASAPAAGDWTGEQRRFHRRLQTLLRQAEEGYAAESYSPQRVARALDEVVREARRFGRGQTHWARAAETKGGERRTAIALELLAAKVLGLASAPLMPETAERLWRGLGYGQGPAMGAWSTALDWVPAGQDVAGLGKPLIPGLEDALLERSAA